MHLFSSYFAAIRLLFKPLYSLDYIVFSLYSQSLLSRFIQHTYMKQVAEAIVIINAVTNQPLFRPCKPYKVYRRHLPLYSLKKTTERQTQTAENIYIYMYIYMYVYIHISIYIHVCINMDTGGCRAKALVYRIYIYIYIYNTHNL